MNNMKKGEKKVSSVEVDSSGKKLVQARLSFKTISSTSSSNNADTSTLNRKRKLSYSDDDKIAAPKIGRLSESKENVPITSGADSSNLVVVSDDEVSKDGNNINSVNAQTDTWSPVVKLQNCDHLVSDSSNSPKKEETEKKVKSNKKNDKTSAKITIKLPLTNKKKKKLTKKSLNYDEAKEVDGNSVEVVSDKTEVSFKKQKTLDEGDLVNSASKENDNEVINDKILSPKENIEGLKNSEKGKDEKSESEKKRSIRTWFTSSSNSKNSKPASSNDIELIEIMSDNEGGDAEKDSVKNPKKSGNLLTPNKKDSPMSTVHKTKNRQKGLKNKATPKKSDKERTKNTINPVKRILGEKLEDPDIISTDDDEILSEKEEKELLNLKSNISEGKNNSEVKPVTNKTEPKVESEIPKVTKDLRDDTHVRKSTTPKRKSEAKKSQDDVKKIKNVKTPKPKSTTEKSGIEKIGKLENESDNEVSKGEDTIPESEKKELNSNSASNNVENISSDDELSENEEINGEEAKDTLKSKSPIIVKNTSPKSGSKIEVTPKQLQRRKESEARRAEREKLKEEKEKKLEEKKKEREEKEKQRIREKEEKEEQRKKDKEEKEELRKKEKEDKEKKRLAEIEVKNEEKRQKEDERKKREEAKEEEKRKREDERKEKELEAELKKKKAAEAFTKFFVKKNKDTKKIDDDPQNSVDSDVNMTHIKFMPFQVKGHMKLAPLCRRLLEEREKLGLEQILTKSVEVPKENLYIQNIRSGKSCPRKYVKTEINDDNNSIRDDDASNDVIILEDELEGAGQSIDDAPKQTFRAKYLLFNENKRPAYYGTWRKKSQVIKSRRPFATDKVFFDYEIDSDDEWEEEEPGESLHGSDDEKESEDEYEVDNDFFVPHGHLSDEELQNEDEEDEDNTPETQKAKLKILQQEFVQEMKKKTEKIKPRLVGIIWTDENGNQPAECPDIIWKSLKKREMMFGTEPISMIPPASTNSSSIHDSPVNEKKSNNKQSKLNEELVKDLIRLVHGNRHKKQFLISEFQAFIAKKFTADPSLGEYTNVSIKNKIEKISEFKIIRNNASKKAKMCWIVQEEVLKKYDLEDLSLINKWLYNLEPKKRHIDDGKEEEKMIAENAADLQQQQNEQKSQQDLIVQNIKTSSRPASPAIIKFTKVLSKEDKEQQFVSSSKDKSLIVKETGIKNVVNQSKSDQTLSPSLSNSKTVADKPITSSPSTVLPKKRVALLMSVPRGQSIPQSSKNALISKFLKKTDESKPEAVLVDGGKVDTDSSIPTSKSNDNNHTSVAPMEIDEVPEVIELQ